MLPTHTSKTDDFKITGLTRIAAKPVAKVNSSQKIHVSTSYESLTCLSRLVAHTDISFDSKTSYRSNPTADTKTRLRINILEHFGTLGGSINANIGTNIPAIPEFLLVNCLSKCGLCRQCNNSP